MKHTPLYYIDILVEMNKIVSALMLAMLATVAAHYGDPNDGGEKDEQPVKTGFGRRLCSPPCSSSGALPMFRLRIMKPTCALSSSSGPSTAHLFVTHRQKRLKTHVSGNLQAIQGTDLYYNDVPAPPSSTHWVPIESPTLKNRVRCLMLVYI